MSDGRAGRPGRVVEFDGALLDRNENRLGHQEFGDRGELVDAGGVPVCDDPLRSDDCRGDIVDRPGIEGLENTHGDLRYR